MTATAAPARARSNGWRGFGRLLRIEFKVWLRDFASVFFAMLFPTLILIGVGFAIPGMRDTMQDMPDPSWNGLTPIATFLPTVLAMAVGTASLTVMPVTIATHREKGVLRRLATTPMRPQGIVVSHLVINVIVTLIGVLLALFAGQFVFDIVAPESLGVVLASFGLGMLSMFSLGMLVAALAPRASSANAIAMLLYFPMLLLAGVWTPGPIMPDLLRDIGQFSPLGATAQSMTAGWFSAEVPWLELAVMAVWTAVLLPLSIRLFRWT